MFEAIEGRPSRICFPSGAVLTIVIVFGLALPPDDVCAQAGGADAAVSMSQDEAASIRQSWQEHVRQEERRVQELASQRRLSRLQDIEPLSDGNRLASERALNDITLERGDIVMTDMGAFVFKGQTQAERTFGDFVPLAGYSFRR
jgi:hypothetical protein